MPLALMAFALAGFLQAALPDTTENQQSSSPDKEGVALSDVWLNVVWDNIDEAAATTESYDVEKITTVAGVRGAEAEDEASRHLYYRSSAREGPSKDEIRGAIERLEKLIQDDSASPRVPSLIHYVIQCHMQLGDYKRAEELISRLTTEHSDSRWAELYKR